MALDSQREDIPRISVETLDDWRRIKRNYTIAALTALDEQLSGNDSAEDRQVLLAHLHRVCCCVCICYRESKLSSPLCAVY